MAVAYNAKDIKKRKMKIERFFRTTPKPTLVENTLFFSILETILGFLFVFFLTTLFFFHHIYYNECLFINITLTLFFGFFYTFIN